MTQHRHLRAALARLVLAAALTVPLTGLVTGCAGGDGTAVDLTPTSSAQESAAAAARAELSTTPSTTEPSTTAGSAAPPVPSSGAAAPGASVGGIAPGLPTALIPAYPGGRVLLTSAQPADGAPGERLDVALAGSTREPPQAVLAFYRATLTAAGFSESTPAGHGDSLTATFTRGGATELIAVAVAASPEQPGEQQFTVGGTVLASVTTATGTPAPTPTPAP